MIIPNQSNVNFDYVLPDGQTIAAELDSNIVNTEILTYSVPKVKSTDKTFMQEGETARHTVVVTNNSQTQLFNLFFKDTMSSGATYVAGSVTVNGVSQPSHDPIAGFALPDLTARSGRAKPVCGSYDMKNIVNTAQVRDYSERPPTVIYSNPATTVLFKPPAPPDCECRCDCRCCRVCDCRCDCDGFEDCDE